MTVMDRMPDKQSAEHDEPIIAEPAPAHAQSADDSDHEREATELRDNPSGLFGRVVPAPGMRPKHWSDPCVRFWTARVRLSVPHVDCRDHLANERTFLAYLRTSLALSMMGVTVSQLYRLQHTPNPGANFGYYVLGEPLSVALQCSAVVILILGATRFFRQQSAMARGRVHAGGWDIFTFMGFLVLLVAALFAVHITVDVYVEDHKQF